MLTSTLPLSSFSLLLQANTALNPFETDAHHDNTSRALCRFQCQPAILLAGLANSHFQGTSMLCKYPS
jgi:hypothetical protein